MTAQTIAFSSFEPGRALKIKMGGRAETPWHREGGARKRHGETTVGAGAVNTKAGRWGVGGEGGWGGGRGRGGGGGGGGLKRLQQLVRGKRAGEK